MADETPVDPESSPEPQVGSGSDGKGPANGARNGNGPKHAKTSRMAVAMDWFKQGNWQRKAGVIGAAAVVLAAGTVIGILASTGGGGHTTATTGGTTTLPPSTTSGHHHSGTPDTDSSLCPLTGLPAPGGKVPDRPALGVKIGNDPNARPQSGLNSADIVFDTQAEGGIVRYIAVYQCHDTTSIGPIRSVRWVDWHVLQELGHVDLAFVHGISYNLDPVAATPWICDLDEFGHGSLYFGNPARQAPEATYASTKSLYSGCANTGPPRALFKYTKTAPAYGTYTTSVHIVYNPVESNILWTWDPTRHAWLHWYDDTASPTADIGADNTQVRATNIVIENVSISYGPDPESDGGTGDVLSQTVGSGTAYILRDGKVYPATWVRPVQDGITTYYGPHHEKLTLAPGSTWIELVPTGDPITFTH